VLPLAPLIPELPLLLPEVDGSLALLPLAPEVVSLAPLEPLAPEVEPLEPLAPEVEPLEPLAPEPMSLEPLVPPAADPVLPDGDDELELLPGVVALELSGEDVVPAAPGVEAESLDEGEPVALLEASGEVVPLAGSELLLPGGVVPALPAAVSDCGAAVVPVESDAPEPDSWPQAARVREARSAASNAEYFFMCRSSQKKWLQAGVLHDWRGGADLSAN